MTNSERVMKHYHDNREKIRAYKADYYQKNKAKFQQRSKEQWIRNVIAQVNA